jgi:murein DD-endopeptidase MepM/ murein hydrolase activator NlpD
LTASKARICIGIAGAFFVGIAAILPVNADTASELKAARNRVTAVQSDLDRLAAAYSAAQTRYAETQVRLETARARLLRTKARMERIKTALSARARFIYESGGATTLELLLSSGSFTQFSERTEFLGQLAQSDSDLIIQAQVASEQLRRYQGDLTNLSVEQAGQIRTLSAQQAAIASKLAEAQSAVAELQRKLEAEAAAAARTLAVSTGSSGAGIGHGALQACPVGQPRAFSDDFGAPRPGGRTHQGIDLLAPLGTPVYAAQSGRFEQNYNSLGGTSALVYADNGDFTYYAHMSSYAGVPSGAHVAAGAMIGHVGNSGDASGGPYHLHFEYHPGGGGAVDPYLLLRAACG